MSKYVWREEIREPAYPGEVLDMEREPISCKWRVTDAEGNLLAVDKYQNDIRERFESMGYVINKIGV